MDSCDEVPSWDSNVGPQLEGRLHYLDAPSLLLKEFFPLQLSLWLDLLAKVCDKSL